MAKEQKESRNMYLKLYHGLRYMEYVPINLTSALLTWMTDSRVLPQVIRYVLGVLVGLIVMLPLLMLSVVFECLAEILALSAPFRKLAGGWWFFAYFPGKSFPCWKEGAHIVNNWIREEAHKDPDCAQGRRVGLVEFEDPSGEWVQRDIQVSWTLNTRGDS